MKTTTHRAAAFSLIEVALALSIAAFCLIPLFGLLPVGLNSNQNATEQTAAASIATSIVADLRGTPKVSGSASPLYGLSFPTSTKPVYHTVWIADGGAVLGTIDQAASTNPPTPRYRAYITLTPPPSGTLYATTARLLITWPAMADSSPTLGVDPKNYSGSYEVVTSLDRNP